MKNLLITCLALCQITSAVFAQSTLEVPVACKTHQAEGTEFNQAHLARFTTAYLGSSKTAEQPMIVWVEGTYYIKADVFYPSGWGQAMIALTEKEGHLMITATSATYECIPSNQDPCIYSASLDNTDVEKSLQCSCVGQGKVNASKGQGNFTALLLSALELRNQLEPCSMP